MSFGNPEFLYLLPLSLLPLILFFLRQFTSVKTKVPSLIWLREKLPAYRISTNSIFTLVLQIICILLFIFSISGTRLSKNTQATENICVVDDLYRSGWTAVLWQKMQNELDLYCNSRYYSYASILRNKLDFADSGYLRQSEPTSNFSAARLSGTFKQSSILIIGARSTGNEFAFETTENIKLFLVQPGEKNLTNAFFFRADIHPFDYARIRLSATFMQREGLLSIDWNNESRELISVQNFSVEHELLARPGYNSYQLKFFTDTESESVSAFHLRKTSGSLGVDTGQAPVTVQSVLQLPREKFSRPWFLQKEGGVPIRKSENCSGSGVFFPDLQNQSDIARGYFNIQNSSGQSLVLSVARRESAEFSLLNENSVIYRFADGLPAVYRNGDSICFSFDPDSVDPELIKNPHYAIFLLNLLVMSVSEENIETVYHGNDLERETNSALFARDFKPGILGKQSNGSWRYLQDEKIDFESYERFLVLNYDPEISRDPVKEASLSNLQEQNALSIFAGSGLIISFAILAVLVSTGFLELFKKRVKKIRYGTLFPASNKKD